MRCPTRRCGGAPCELAAARGPQQLRFTRRLLDGPARVRAWLRQFLEDCDEAFFADTWSPAVPPARRRRPPQDRAAAPQGAWPRRWPPCRPSLTLDGAGSAAERIVVDKLVEGRTHDRRTAGLLLVPTSLGWPHLMVLHRSGWRPVIHYPVGSPEPAAPLSVEQLALRMAALSHPVRMRLCRNLARGPYTTGELAQMLRHDPAGDIPPPGRPEEGGPAHHAPRGRYVLHQLDVTVVARLGSDFLEGLLR